MRVSVYVCVCLCVSCPHTAIYAGAYDAKAPRRTNAGRAGTHATGTNATGESQSNAEVSGSYAFLVESLRLSHRTPARPLFSLVPLPASPPSLLQTSPHAQSQMGGHLQLALDQQQQQTQQQQQQQQQPPQQQQQQQQHQQQQQQQQMDLCASGENEYEALTHAYSSS